MDNYLLPLMVNILVALCTYTAPLLMYIVSMIGMEGEIQFVCFRVYNNKHINCFSLLIKGKDPVRCRYIYTARFRNPLPFSSAYKGNELCNGRYYIMKRSPSFSPPRFIISCRYIQCTVH